MINEVFTLQQSNLTFSMCLFFQYMEPMAAQMHVYTANFEHLYFINGRRYLMKIRADQLYSA